MNLNRLLLLICLYLPMLLIGQSFKSLNKEFYRYYEEDQYEKAIAMVPDLVAAAEENIDDAEEMAQLAYNIGEMYFLLGDYENCMIYWGGAVENYRTVSETSFEFGFYGFSYARVLHELGNYSDAKAWYEATLYYLSEGYGQFSQDYADCFRFYAEVVMDMALYDEAQPLIEAVVYFYQEITGTESFEYWDARMMQALLYHQSGQYDKATVEFQDILEHGSSLSETDPANYGIILNNIGELNREIGQYDEAERMYLEAMQIFEQLDSKIDLAMLFNNLALAHAARSMYTDAEAAYVRSLDLYDELDMLNHLDATHPMNNLSDLYNQMGRSMEAVELLQQVIEIRYNSLGGAHPSYGHALNNLALVYMDLWEVEDAAELLQAAYDTYYEAYGRDHRFIANVLHNQAMLYHSTGHIRKAVEHADMALEVMLNVVGEHHPLYATYLGSAGMMDFEAGNVDRALSRLNHSLELTREHVGTNTLDYFHTEFAIGMIHARTGDQNKALDWIRRSVNGYQSLILEWFPSLSETEKTQFYYTLSWRYDYLNALLLDMTASDSTATMLLNNSMATKGLLLDQSSEVRANILNSGDEELIGLYEQWLYQRGLLLQQYQLTEEELEQAGIDIRQVERDLNRLEKEISNRSAAFSLRSDRPGIAELGGMLEADEAIVNIMRVYGDTNLFVDSVYYVAQIIRAGQDAPTMVRVKEAGLLDHEHASDYQRMIHGLIRDSLSYERYWQDIDAALEGIDHVYFSPDGVYHKVNPATLFDMDEQVYVIEKYGMTLLTNPIDLAHRQAPAPGLMTASLYGNPDYTFVPDGFEQETSRGNSIEYTSLSPLPGTKVEVQNITDVLVENGWEVSSWTGHQATEAQLKSEDSPRLLHIATHGFFLPEMNVSADMVFGIRSDRSWANPLLRSGLMLASATANIISQQLDDGIFTAFEAASMDLTQTELVVLSACETGLGEVRDEQGVYGLQRAFLMAGADNLMMSLWQVADQPTQKLMSEFYAAWASGTPMADAFRDAQLELMKTHPEPIYWGAFVHVQR